MGRYVQNTLQINEDILIEPKLHWAVYIDAYFQIYILYLIFCHFMHFLIIKNIGFGIFFHDSQIIIGIFVLLRIIYLFVRNYLTEMAVTNYRVVYKVGIFNIHTEELANGKIESVSVRQSIMGRILNYGDIHFSGTGTSKLVFPKIYAPWWVKSRAEDIIRQSYEEMREYPYYQKRNY